MYIGIDISKDSLDVAVHDTALRWRFTNDRTGIAKLCKKLKKMELDLIVFEATGGYEMPLLSQS